MGAFIVTLFNLFGAPDRVAREGMLTRAQHKLLTSWLKAGEAMLRRLLLIEARALTVAPVTPRTHTRKPRVTHPHAFDADSPETWRVSFRCSYRRLPAGNGARNAKQSLPARSRRYANAWPIAERMEAMLRVYNDPTTRARSLARWLARHDDRAIELVEAPEEAARLFGEDHFHAAEHLAEAALKRKPDG
jgi:hypothetical protein